MYIWSDALCKKSTSSAEPVVNNIPLPLAKAVLSSCCTADQPVVCCGADKALKLQVQQLLDKAEHLPQDMLSGGPASVLTLQIYLRCNGTAPLTDVTLTFHVPAGLHLSQVTFTLPDMSCIEH